MGLLNVCLSFTITALNLIDAYHALRPSRLKPGSHQSTFQAAFSELGTSASIVAVSSRSRSDTAMFGGEDPASPSTLGARTTSKLRAGSLARRDRLRSTLTLLVLWHLFQTVEQCLGTFLSYLIPFFPTFKLLFLTWLLLGREQAAQTAFRRFVHPVARPYEPMADFAFHRLCDLMTGLQFVSSLTLVEGLHAAQDRWKQLTVALGAAGATARRADHSIESDRVAPPPFDPKLLRRVVPPQSSGRAAMPISLSPASNASRQAAVSSSGTARGASSWETSGKAQRPSQLAAAAAAAEQTSGPWGSWGYDRVSTSFPSRVKAEMTTSPPPAEPDGMGAYAFIPSTYSSPSGQQQTKPNAAQVLERYSDFSASRVEVKEEQQQQVEPVIHGNGILSPPHMPGFFAKTPLAQSFAAAAAGDDEMDEDEDDDDEEGDEEEEDAVGGAAADDTFAHVREKGRGRRAAARSSGTAPVGTRSAAPAYHIESESDAGGQSEASTTASGRSSSKKPAAKRSKRTADEKVGGAKTFKKQAPSGAGGWRKQKAMAGGKSTDEQDPTATPKAQRKSAVRALALARGGSQQSLGAWMVPGATAGSSDVAMEEGEEDHGSPASAETTTRVSESGTSDTRPTRRRKIPATQQQPVLPSSLLPKAVRNNRAVSAEVPKRGAARAAESSSSSAGAMPKKAASSRNLRSSRSTVNM